VLLLLLPCVAVWLLHEQVGIALMECGALQQALPLVKAVLIKFKGSIRARRLQVTAAPCTQDAAAAAVAAAAAATAVKAANAVTQPLRHIMSEGSS
jgi:hypothetical protein